MPNWLIRRTLVLARSSLKFSNSRSSSSRRWRSYRRSMKSQMMTPPRSRSLSWRGISSAASMSVLKAVISASLWSRILPELTSIVTTASVESMTRLPPLGSGTWRLYICSISYSMPNRLKRGTGSSYTSTRFLPGRAGDADHVLDPAGDVGVVDDDAGHVGAEHVADGAGDQVPLGVQLGRSGAGVPPLLDLLPQAGEVGQVPLDVLPVLVDGLGADDEPAVLGRVQVDQDPLEAAALVLVLDLLAHAPAGHAGHHDQHFAADGQVAAQGRPLVPIPSLMTWTMISSPRRRQRWMGGRSRRAIFLPTYSSTSSLPLPPK